MLTRWRFETTAKFGYLVVVAILLLGAAFAIRRSASASTQQIARLREAEREITLVERLRRNAELIVSDGRGYLVIADPKLLAAVRASERWFDENVRALHTASLTERGTLLVTEAQGAAARFREVQEQLLEARKTTADGPALARRFEAELLPRRRALEEALDRLVEYRQAALRASYREAREEQWHLELALYGLLGALALVGFGLALTFGRLLGRAYRHEHDALETARRALATRDDVMGMVAHDLRNPLGAILMRTELLASEDAPPRLRSQLEPITRAARRMENLIRCMLDLATLEAGRFTVTKAPCDVDALVRDLSDQFAAAATSRHVRFEVEQTPGLQIVADRDRIMQVLSNLLGNALKFTPEHGTITLTARQADDVTRFTVDDTGPGIPPESVPHLFERYWKRESAGKKGTGLGLFIAKGIVEAHGGTIRATNAAGGGASFTFTIPAVISEADGRRAAAAPSM